MKRLRQCMVVLAVLSLVNTGWTEQAKTEPELRLSLDLVDGSRVIGVPSIKSVPVQTPYATMDIALKQIKSIKIEDDPTKKSKVGKFLTVYEIDYNKCLFCSLCIDPCPVDCIHMGQQFDLASFNNGSGVKIDFMDGEGEWRTAATSADPDSGLRPHLLRLVGKQGDA